MWAALKKLIASVLVASLIPLGPACTNLATASKAGVSAVGETRDSEKRAERNARLYEAERKYQNAWGPLEKEKARQELESEKWSQRRESEIDAIFDLVVFAIVTTATFVELESEARKKRALEKAEAKNAQKQEPPEKSRPENTKKQRPLEKAQIEKPQKQKPGGLASLGWSSEAPHPGLSRGYVPPAD